MQRKTLLFGKQGEKVLTNIEAASGRKAATWERGGGEWVPLAFGVSFAMAVPVQNPHISDENP